MSTPVLIAFGTRFGCTQEVAERIGILLEDQGIDTTRVDLVTTPQEEWPSIHEFKGIIVGSSIKGNRWTKEPQKFLKMNKKDLEKSSAPLGIFVCSLTAVADREGALEKYVNRKSKKMGVAPDITDAFGGVLDFSESSPLGTFEKTMMMAAIKNIEKDIGRSLSQRGRNDLRDWNQIETFARKYAALMKETYSN
jgi:menaquinone-dependent protoporphyrinogen IX oxidase